MRNQASRAIFDYWINLKSDGAAPLRTAIDPAALRHLLPQLFIATADAGGRLVFRLAGTRVCDLFDREFRGAAFAEIWLEHEHRQPEEIVHDVMRYELPALLDVLAATAGVRRAYEMLLLPVRPTDGDGSDRVLGALLPQEGAFAAAELPVTGLALESWAFIAENDAEESPHGRGHFGLGGNRLRRRIADGQPS